MIDRKNNDPKEQTFETEKTVERSNRHSNRAPRRGERERSHRDGVAVYGQATSPIPAGNNLSWASIFAGAVSAAACFATLSLLTAALGFGLFSPTTTDPLSGVGVGTGIWTAITLILSFLAGGFVAGYSARSTGKLHGVITWAVTLLLLLTFVINAIGQVLGAATNVAGKAVDTAANVTGNVAGSTISVAGDAVGAGVEKAGDAIGEVDTKDLEENVEKYLSDTDVEELQPDYLNNQLEESKDEVVQAVKDIALNPDNSDQIISDLTKSLKDKASTIADSADRDAIANAVAQNSDLTQEEAEQATDNIYNGLVDASKEAQAALNDASDKIEKYKSDVEEKADETVENAKEGADEASNKISAGSVIAFLGLIVALGLSAWAGQLGEQKSLEVVRKETIR